MFVILYVLLVRVCADYLAEVPHKRGFACGLLALLRGLIAESRGLGAAVDAHGVPAPALLFLEQSRAAAERAVVQLDLIKNIRHTYHSTEIM